MCATENQQDDDIFVIYPAHLEWLMNEHRLTVPEICAALGMPSIQEWYQIRKNPEMPVRHRRVVQSARIYLRHPERLPVSRPSIGQFIDRAVHLVGDEVLAKRMIEAVLDKQWSAIESWMNGDIGAVELSARRLIYLYNDMDDEEFLKTLQDGALNSYVQVNASLVYVYQKKDSIFRDYATPWQPDLLRGVEKMLELIPKPGKRMSKEEYVTPDNPLLDPRGVLADLQTSQKNQGPGQQDLSDTEKEDLSIIEEVYRAQKSRPWG